MEILRGTLLTDSYETDRIKVLYSTFIYGLIKSGNSFLSLSESHQLHFWRRKCGNTFYAFSIFWFVPRAFTGKVYRIKQDGRFRQRSVTFGLQDFFMSFLKTLIQYHVFSLLSTSISNFFQKLFVRNALSLQQLISEHSFYSHFSYSRSRFY